MRLIQDFLKNAPCLIMLAWSILVQGHGPAGHSYGKIKEMAVMGNSFTIHPVTDYWWGEWGMAAACRDSDYCHILQQLITQWQDGDKPEMTIHNVADFERGHGSPSVRDKTVGKLSGTEDLIVLRLGECVSNFTDYTEDLEALIDQIKAHSPNAAIVMSGSFWPSSQRDDSQSASALSRSCIWCPLRSLCSKETMATINDKVYGDDNEWHFIKDGGLMAQGVANHANNLGHRLIAENLFDSIRSSWRLSAIAETRPAPPAVIAVEYYDLGGRRINGKPLSGVYIVRKTYSDGHRESKKVVVTNQ